MACAQSQDMRADALPAVLSRADVPRVAGLSLCDGLRVSSLAADCAERHWASPAPSRALVHGPAASALAGLVFLSDNLRRDGLHWLD